MAEKQSILGRIGQLARANINALLDRAEDPQKMLDQLVRDYTNSISEAEDAIAVTIGNLRLAEADHAEDLKEAEDWGRKAIAASDRAEQFRGAGDDANAQKFDDLAKVAISKQIAAESEAKSAEPMIESQNEVVDQLKDGLQTMHQKLDQLKSKRDSLVARQKSAHAQAQVQESMASINVLDPTSEISRYEEQIRREEAAVAGRAELQSSSIADQFAELEDASKNIEIEARLAALKGGNKEKPAIESGDSTIY
ncbi:PspA/IM30 family protein [Flaviflexus ciconiae]|uniref:PspA/IM30 family protein n=1 Tax=Flaviflexus ciconiae TaxID=2496867 RepID=A0A3Q9G839_9ACTO|nr:PspA/IM30 family protein [Flaviflexus ciconiae]AZQ77801.1 PspA/IM30 family protein [Flaviflexus ciconiae]